jgi:hypothetical protein
LICLFKSISDGPAILYFIRSIKKPLEMHAWGVDLILRTAVLAVI